MALEKLNSQSSKFHSIFLFASFIYLHIVGLKANTLNRYGEQKAGQPTRHCSGAWCSVTTQPCLWEQKGTTQHPNSA